MKRAMSYGIAHLVLLAVCTMKAGYRSPTMYNVLTTTTNNSIVHILHVLLLIFVMCFLTNVIVGSVFKSLRLEEVSSFHESLLYFLTDFLLVVPTFDGDINFKNGMLFAMLLCIKSLSWLLGIRIKREAAKEQYYLAYGICAFSCIVGCMFMMSCMTRMSGHILFVFEYMLLVIASIKNIFVMNMSFYEDEEKRSQINFYIDIVYMSITFVAYVVFIGITSLSYRLPLNLFRSALGILDALISKIKTFARYIKLCKDLEKCTDGTGDGFCAICRDDLASGKNLGCGHCFHLGCLKMWCERQQTCPICKSPILLELKKETFVVGNELISGIPVTMDE
ncbi:HRD ubiquitin ligase complex protein [Ordospora colligata]|uniref:HRD ubiquitin ligase complex protein n=1 Tax=Ordospora colligata OC4 TaxID=1354746 RepID=A0A0B2UMX0_9MICR|nr:HRD ubiquitin ligase complex protein [Ordospora colligata OC4]KHN70412.1 HRD ubiquitin ligase complex protein [Ordospora colligata OC4]TBU17162.1 HRD ubiquitin ligase complex protein [Ordospora colligata]TBU17412.1 HRD ubiquitin ligase complex protein [Ordospora colligata]TBU19592.1 HRD ubiquitin ligase complex protein [Ordospora colligata]